MFLWNIYNVPAGVIPVTVVKKGEDVYEEEVDGLWKSAAQKSI